MSKMLVRFFTLLSLIIFFGCMFRAVGTEKKLFSWTLTKAQLANIKNVLAKEGYQRISKEDYRYEGAYVTQYAKEVKTAREIKNNRVQIMMSFKTDNLENDRYRNFGFSVFNINHDDVVEINSEIQRIEDVIYKQLIDDVGTGNVVRGPR